MREVTEYFVIKTFLYGPVDYAKLKLLCRGKDLHVSETRKRNGYTSSREEENVDAHLCPCGTTTESRAPTLDARYHRGAPLLFLKFLFESSTPLSKTDLHKNVTADRMKNPWSSSRTRIMRNNDLLIVPIAYCLLPIAYCRRVWVKEPRCS